MSTAHANRSNTAKNKQAFLRAFRKTATVTGACAVVKIDRTTVWDWRQQDPEFAAAYDEAHEIATDALEEAARERALATSDLLLIFLLKAKRPEIYRDQRVLEVVERYQGLPDAELNRRLRARLGEIAARGEAGDARRLGDGSQPDVIDAPYQVSE